MEQHIFRGSAEVGPEKDARRAVLQLPDRGQRRAVHQPRSARPIRGRQAVVVRDQKIGRRGPERRGVAGGGVADARCGQQTFGLKRTAAGNEGKPFLLSEVLGEGEANFGFRDTALSASNWLLMSTNVERLRAGMSTCPNGTVLSD